MTADRFVELLQEAMTEELLLAPADCWCPVSAPVLGVDEDGEPAIVVHARLQFVVPMCPHHGTPARRRWWQTQSMAERARLHAWARVL